MHEQSLELTRQHLGLSQETTRLYQRAVEQQEANAKVYRDHQEANAKVHRDQQAETKQMRRWALVLLAVLMVVILASILWPHHGR